MKKIILILLAIVTLSFVSNTISAQSFAKGDNVIGFGFGIGGNYGAYKSYSSQTPALGIMYEKGMSWEAGPGVIGLGGYLGYKSLTARDDFYNYKWSYTIIGIRSAYHYEFTDHLDTYGGLMLAYNVVSFTDKTVYPYGFSYSGASASGIDLSLYLGARYYFSSQWGAFAELGYGIATLQLGAVYKF